MASSGYTEESPLIDQSVEVGTATTTSATSLRQRRTLAVSADELRTIESLASSRGEVHVPDDVEIGARTCFSFSKLWTFIGPGLLMSIAYVDPGNLESDLQAGGYAGYQLIWVLFAATAAGCVLQILAVRLGVVTGFNLAETARTEYNKKVSLTLWVMMEIAIIGSDIQEVLGSAIALQILFKLPLWAGCLLTGMDTFTLLSLHAFGIRMLEAFFSALILTMCVCFFINLRMGSENLVTSESLEAEILKGFAPHLSHYAVVQAVGILGAVIMPHNLYLHSALVQSRKIKRTDPAKVKEAIFYFSVESVLALFVSFLINLAVLVVFANGFFSPDCSATFDEFGLNTACVGGRPLDSGPVYRKCTLADGTSGSCQEIGLSQAHMALEGSLGTGAKIVWAVGLLAAGQSSTMTGTFAGQFVFEGFLQVKIAPWKRVLLTRCIALIPALCVALLNADHPLISDDLDEWLNVLQSVQLPFALLPLLHFTSMPELMNINGGVFSNGPVLKATSWVIALIVLVINVYLVGDFVGDVKTAQPTVVYVLLACAGLLYFFFVYQLVARDIRNFRAWINDCIRGTNKHPNRVEPSTT